MAKKKKTLNILSNKKLSKKLSKKSLPLPLKSKDIPASYGALQSVRSELSSKIVAVHLEVKSLAKTMDSKFKLVDSKFKLFDSKFKKVDARFNEVDARFDKVDARFDRVDARFDKMDARFDKVDARFDKMDARFAGLEASASRMISLIEEQNSRNVITLDAYSVLYESHSEVKERIDNVEKNQYDIARLLSKK